LFCFLQETLPRLSRPALTRAKDELAPHLYSLSKHTFGNYLISRLATLGVFHQALAIAFRGKVVELLCHAQVIKTKTKSKATPTSSFK